MLAVMTFEPAYSSDQSIYHLNLSGSNTMDSAARYARTLIETKNANPWVDVLEIWWHGRPIRIALLGRLAAEASGKIVWESPAEEIE